MSDLDRILTDFSAECAEIADMCEAEGYPTNGSNYDLRVDNLAASYRQIYPQYAEYF